MIAYTSSRKPSYMNSTDFALAVLFGGSFRIFRMTLRIPDTYMTPFSKSQFRICRFR